MYIGIHVNFHLFMSDFNINIDFLVSFFEKYSNIKYHENPSNESRAVSCGQTDMTKLRVAFRNFANALQNWHGCNNSSEKVKERRQF
jgi:hypothetical protein